MEHSSRMLEELAKLVSKENLAAPRFPDLVFSFGASLQAGATGPVQVEAKLTDHLQSDDSTVVLKNWAWELTPIPGAGDVGDLVAPYHYTRDDLMLNIEWAVRIKAGGGGWQTATLQYHDLIAPDGSLGLALWSSTLNVPGGKCVICCTMQIAGKL